MHETIKKKCLERSELFIDEEGDALATPKIRCLYLLNISWGDTGVASPSLSFCPFFISFHHSLSTPNFFSLIQNFTQSSLTTLAYSKDIRHLEKLWNNKTFH